jgi:hypothetical protein
LADFILLMCVALTAKLEAANKAFAEEKASRQVVDQASQESRYALNRDLQSVWASADILKEELEAAHASATTAREELSSKSAALDDLVDQEREA